jgi:hypothetical protein
MQAKWFAGEKDPQAFKESLQASGFILDKLKKICYNILYKKDSEIDLDSPNWAVHKAYDMGYNKAIDDLAQFLDVSDRETNKREA